MVDPPPKEEPPHVHRREASDLEEVVSPTRSRFAIEPLEPGFGYTVGNSLRRTLLSSIPGAAISSVRIDGVLHEFSTVPKVTEDVTDVILNLKELVARSELEEPTTVYLKAKGRPRSPPATSRRPRASRSSTPTCTSPRSARARASRWR